MRGRGHRRYGDDFDTYPSGADNFQRTAQLLTPFPHSRETVASRATPRDHRRPRRCPGCSGASGRPVRQGPAGPPRNRCNRRTRARQLSGIGFLVCASTLPIVRALRKTEGNESIASRTLLSLSGEATKAGEARQLSGGCATTQINL